MGQTFLSTTWFFSLSEYFHQRFILFHSSVTDAIYLCNLKLFKYSLVSQILFLFSKIPLLYQFCNVSIESTKLVVTNVPSTKPNTDIRALNRFIFPKVRFPYPQTRHPTCIMRGVYFTNYSNSIISITTQANNCLHDTSEFNV
jgi:hypothetical protein